MRPLLSAPLTNTWRWAESNLKVSRNFNWKSKIYFSKLTLGAAQSTSQTMTTTENSSRTTTTRTTSCWWRTSSRRSNRTSEKCTATAFGKSSTTTILLLPTNHWRRMSSSQSRVKLPRRITTPSSSSESYPTCQASPKLRSPIRSGSPLAGEWVNGAKIERASHNYNKLTHFPAHSYWIGAVSSTRSRWRMQSRRAS